VIVNTSVRFRFKLTRYVTHLGRRLRPVAQETADGHLGSRSVLQHLVLEVVFSLLDVVPLAPAAAIVRVVVLIGVHLDVVAVNQKYGRVLGEELLQTCQSPEQRCQLQLCGH